MESEQKFQELVKLALKNEDLIDYTIEIQGQLGKGENFLSVVTFVKVNGRTKNGGTKSLDLLIKVSKSGENLRKTLPMTELFNKEIHIYEKVVPEFNKLQQENGVRHLTKNLPLYYTSYRDDQMEALIFEDLRPQGFRLRDRKLGLDQEHAKLVLEAYGKWHALSFALKQKKFEVFEKLVENNKNMFSEFILTSGMDKSFLDGFRQARNFLLDSKIFNAETLKDINFTEEDVEYFFLDLHNEEPQYHVISHGDSWINNFLFKYDDNSKKPSDVRVLDYQDSGLTTPVSDLSYFIYCCCIVEDVQELTKLLTIYHESLSKSLKSFQLDPNEIFSFDTLWRHWKKFSGYGFFLSSMVINGCLSDSADAPDLTEIVESGTDVSTGFSFTVKNIEEYTRRIKKNFVLYSQCLVHNN